MKCVRFEDLRTGNKRIGFIDGDVIRCVYGSLETYWQITDETFAMRDVRLLAPCVPKQIICVSFNYQKHAAEFGVEIPREPSIFLRLRIPLSVQVRISSGRSRCRSWPLARNWVLS